MKRFNEYQLSLFEHLGFYDDGDIVPFSSLGHVVTFEWLISHIGYQVAFRYSQESMTYYRVYTVGYVTKGTFYSNCRRVVLTCHGKAGPLLDEPGFFMPFYCYLVYEL